MRRYKLNNFHRMLLIIDERLINAMLSADDPWNYYCSLNKDGEVCYNGIGLWPYTPLDPRKVIIVSIDRNYTFGDQPIPITDLEAHYKDNYGFDEVRFAYDAKNVNIGFFLSQEQMDSMVHIKPLNLPLIIAFKYSGSQFHCSLDCSSKDFIGICDTRKGKPLADPIILEKTKGVTTTINLNSLDYSTLPIVIQENNYGVLIFRANDNIESLKSNELRALINSEYQKYQVRKVKPNGNLCSIQNP